MENNVQIFELKSLEVFNSESVDSVISKIEQEARCHKFDVSSDKGRKEVASLAYKVSRSKTFLDDLGKKLGEDAKLKLDAINLERKKIRDKLDSLKDEVRKPLTDWEEQEAQRVLNHNKDLKKIYDCIYTIEKDWQNCDLLNFKNYKEELEKLQNKDWQEFKDKASESVILALEKVNIYFEKRELHDKEKEELRKLRLQESIRLEKEKADELAKQAADKAKLDAENLAKEVEIRAKKEIEAANKKSKDLELSIEREKNLAIEKERIRVENEKAKAILEEKKREENKKHCATINGEVLRAIMLLSGITDVQGKTIISSIVLGKVPHTKITY